jgi:DNA-binding transcriptional ArsR family regulator
MRDELVLADARLIRALAHPLRIRMLSRLQQEGPATATMLAEALNESTANTSYHLRQLARHGLIEEDLERGDQRDRWWAAVARHYNVGSELETSPEHRAAVAALRADVLEHDAAVVASFFDNEEQYDPELRGEATFTNYVVYATPGELGALRDKLSDAIRELERPDPATRPAGATRWYGVLRVVPWPPQRPPP